MYNLIMIKNRYILENVLEDLNEKMVFIGGPRQVGKTVFAKDIIGRKFKSSYYNWDNIESRLKALKSEWNYNSELIILDEFHKFPKWKTWIKGEYDMHRERFKFILTGSARLNIFRRGGDSLQGRYYYYTLFPFTLSEVEDINNEFTPLEELKIREKEFESVNELIKFGGFPEPLFKQSEKYHRRWVKDRFEKLIDEDIRDLTLLRDTGNLLLLSEILKTKVSSVLSINSVSRELQVNFRTAENWFSVFEKFYYCFRIPPYNKKSIKSVKKEKKLYMWDWSVVEDKGARLENLVALHLLKFVFYLRDAEGYDVNLFYIRDVNGREVDFLVSFKGLPWFSVEVKANDTALSRNLLYFSEKLKIPYNYQLVNKKGVDFLKSGVRVISMSKFLSALV